ncbi:MAG: transketolase [Clostridiales bacterium]|jgi:transketolase|nr:transketolase [Clostridiales bacterium]
MDKQQINTLQRIGCQIRMNILRCVFAAKSGHPGGSLSSADILAWLYEKELRHDPKNPGWEGRDRFVLSKGHAAPVLYAALAHFGYFPADELDKLRHTGQMLQGHPDMKGTPGIDMSTGSLGQGFSAACGMSLAAKKLGKGYRVYVLLGDGECEEGQVWEASMFAAKEKLDNLCVTLDYNGLQIDGAIADVGGPEPFDKKFEAFGWNVLKANAHDFEELSAAYAQAKETKGKPSVVIAKSTKGKHVSFMENKAEWHGKAPNKEQYDQAMQELSALMERLVKEGA